ncbi:cation-dependent mannose-6-phosphate receptor [Cetorhinus maximus]
MERGGLVMERERRRCVPGARSWELLINIRLCYSLSFNVTSTNATTKESYTYTFRVCAPVNGQVNAGLVQYNDNVKESKVIGRINATQLIGGSDWIILIYGDGDQYLNFCSKERRKGMVMISCNPKVLGAAFSAVLEERRKFSDCFYLFELDSSVACPTVPHRLSPGSILIILFLVLLTVYILGGFLYQRLVLRAKGMEQFPNYYFWQEIGNLTADGCDFVCRSKPRGVAAAYRGVGDEQLGDDEEEERDEHLLPM